MSNSNFGKDIRDLEESELFRNINNSNPQYGALCQYELLRRLSVENSISSKRFAYSSLFVAIISIIITIMK